MKIQLVLILLLVAVLTLCTAAPQLITTRRKFPGQRRLGAARYKFHTMGKNGYSSKRPSRNSINRGSSRRRGNA